MQSVVYRRSGGRERQRDKQNNMYSQVRQIHRRRNRRIVSVCIVAAVLLSCVCRAYVIIQFSWPIASEHHTYYSRH